MIDFIRASAAVPYEPGVRIVPPPSSSAHQAPAEPESLTAFNRWAEQNAEWPREGQDPTGEELDRLAELCAKHDDPWQAASEMDWGR